MLSKFSRVMKGRKIFEELINELASIYKLDELFIIVKRDNNNCRIKGIYNKDLNKLKYPKNFRKTIYDVEYIDDYECYKKENDFVCYNYSKKPEAKIISFNTIFCNKELKRKLLGIYDYSLPWSYYY